MDDVKLGGGLLGHLDKGGQFHVRQAEVAPGSTRGHGLVSESPTFGPSRPRYSLYSNSYIHVPGWTLVCSAFLPYVCQQDPTKAPTRPDSAKQTFQVDAKIAFSPGAGDPRVTRWRRTTRPELFRPDFDISEMRKFLSEPFCARDRVSVGPPKSRLSIRVAHDSKWDYARNGRSIRTNSRNRKRSRPGNSRFSDWKLKET